eukprot:scaffold144899_cov24-Tisochrysis_lutea.AAC.1
MLACTQSGLVLALMTAKARNEVSGVYGRLGRWFTWFCMWGGTGVAEWRCVTKWTCKVEARCKLEAEWQCKA